ncbi:MAG: 50S ribosomal protein L20, partial [Candidatus Marinimicrobia bacterium]|nr:50S ribosomal protein L20 [Candidatus Neomarinimicrobiota bacterium]
AARLNGLSYSILMNGLKKSSIDLNRKMLAEIAVTDPVGFASIVAKTK